MKQIVGMK